MRHRITRSALVVVALFFAIAPAGCETVKGVGKDIQGASTSVQQAFFE